MRKIEVRDLIPKVRDLCLEASWSLRDDVFEALNLALLQEKSPLAKEVLKEMIENAKIAKGKKIPVCQDTGLAVFFIEMGQTLQISGGNLYEALNEGVKEGYKELRKSTCCPFIRKNRDDNTPGIFHLKIVPGDKLKISLLLNGSGCENMSTAQVLTPAVGFQGIKDLVKKRVKEAGPKPCPPSIIGVGIGGTLERSAYLAKECFLRSLKEENPDPELAKMEKELLESFNRLGIGPMGLGGKTTCLRVFINAEPCHIASLPIAVSFQCYLLRQKEIII